MAEDKNRVSRRARERARVGLAYLICIGRTRSSIGQAYLASIARIRSNIINKHRSHQVMYDTFFDMQSKFLHKIVNVETRPHTLQSDSQHLEIGHKISTVPRA